MFTGIAVWAATKLGGIGGKTLEFIIAVVLLIVLVGGPYWLGMRHQAQADEATRQTQIAAAAKVLAAKQVAGEKIAAKAAVAQAKVQVVYRTITQEIPHVVTVYRPAPFATLRPIPRAVFTVGFTRLWNHALDPELSAATAEPAGAASAADPALDSGLGEADIVSNHSANAEQYDTCRRQLNTLIDWHHQIGATP